MPISYKNKIYTTLGTPTEVTSDSIVSISDSAGRLLKDYTIEGKSIVWNQLLDKSKYLATVTRNGVTFTNNKDGTITVNGTCELSAGYVSFPLYGYPRPEEGEKVGHKYGVFGCPSGGSNSTYRMNTSIRNSDGSYFGGFSDVGEGNISKNAITEGQYILCEIAIYSGYTANNLVFKPQLFDLTQMFGAGNEPSTPEEFRAMFPEDYYSYNAGELKTIVPTSVEAKNQSGETRFVNIPSSKYFPDGMRSAGSAYDEINFLSQKAIKRIGVRAYQTGDENNTAVMTDKTNTVYELATPVETEITPPLQALSTFKGFTSFSAPNSLMQNGPLSVTYYAEGGTNPENGWLTSYKRKLYMGRSIEWNQLLDKSKYPATTTSSGVTFTNNGDGTITVNGTARSSDHIYRGLRNNIEVPVGHKILISGGVTGAGRSSYLFYDASNSIHGIDSPGGGKIYTVQTNPVDPYLFVAKGYTVSNITFKPQLFDLTQMFGAGNEPSTPAEFWSYFDHKLYPYNTGETQPLFKISRKSQWGSATPASLYVGEDIIILQIVRN